MTIKLLLRIILLSMIMFSAGYGISNARLKDKYFNKDEIIEAHGSFDERLNLIEERVSLVEDSTKSGRLNNQ